jgi:hypothetical protein
MTDASIEESKWTLVPLVLLLGFGSHCVAHALSPAEKDLAELGLGPMLYGMLILMPKLGSIFTPALWGYFFARDVHTTIVVAPSLRVRDARTSTHCRAY